MNKQRFKFLGLCDIPNSSYSAKGTTQNNGCLVWRLQVDVPQRDTNMAAGN